MVDQNKIITTQVIEDVVKNASSDRVLVRDLVQAMESLGFGLVMMLFAFGIIITLPPPFPSIIALPLVVFSIQMLIGYESPKLPKRFSNLSVKRSVLVMLIQKSSPHIRRIERFLRPRLSFMISPKAERFIGFFTLIFSLFIVLPMPLSNFIPGFGILIIAFGLLGKDGLVVVCGIIVGIVGVAISSTAVLLGVEVIYYLKNLLFG